MVLVKWSVLVKRLVIVKWSVMVKRFVMVKWSVLVKTGLRSRDGRAGGPLRLSVLGLRDP